MSRAWQFADNVQSFSTLNRQTCLILPRLESTSPFPSPTRLKQALLTGLGSRTWWLRVAWVSMFASFHKKKEVLGGLGLPLRTDAFPQSWESKGKRREAPLTFLLSYELLFPCAGKASHLRPLFAAALPYLPAGSLAVPSHRQPQALDALAFPTPNCSCLPAVRFEKQQLSPFATFFRPVSLKHRPCLSPA